MVCGCWVLLCGAQSEGSELIDTIKLDMLGHQYALSKATMASHFVSDGGLCCSACDLDCCLPCHPCRLVDQTAPKQASL